MLADRHYTYNCFIVGAFNFPHGDASSQRLLTIAQAAAVGGLRPLVINDATGTDTTSRPGQTRRVDGVDYILLEDRSVSPQQRAIHRLFRARRVGRIIAMHKQKTGRPAVIVSSGLCTLTLMLAFRLLFGLRVIPDVVERHDASQFPRGHLEPYFVRHRWTSALARRLADRVIVISTRLACGYGGMRPAPLVVPPLVDLERYPRKQRAPSSTLELLYIGNPRGKDQLGIAFDAIGALDPDERSRVRLTIAGANIAALTSNPDVGPHRVHALNGSLSAVGFVNRPRVLELLSQADFTILFRPSGGYSAAGFPTKVPESLAAGCPVLCNLTSDLGEYLVDGENALLCPSAPGSDEISVQTLKDTLRRALALTPREKAEMNGHARHSAERFGVREWGHTLVGWLEVAA